MASEEEMTNQLNVGGDRVTNTAGSELGPNTEFFVTLEPWFLFLRRKEVRVLLPKGPSSSKMPPLPSPGEFASECLPAARGGDGGGDTFRSPLRDSVIALAWPAPKAPPVQGVWGQSPQPLPCPPLGRPVPRAMSSGEGIQAWPSSSPHAPENHRRSHVLPGSQS